MLPKLPHAVAKLLDVLRAAEGGGWLVGGALRDLLRGETPGDWDIATTLTPEELLGIFPYARLIGGHCGTVLVKWNEVTFEITPTRAEADYTDGRHPERVQFVPSILQDLARRDFTVNAMAYDGRVLLDPFGGQRDLDAGLIRCVGDAARRFAEDRLRILRMLRFSAALGFAVEPDTLRAAEAAMPQVGLLSRERVRSELARILLGPRPDVLEGLVRHGGLARYGFFTPHALGPLRQTPALPSCRWWAFCTLCAADIRQVGLGFGFSRRFVDTLCEMDALFRSGPAPTALALKRKLRDTGLDYESASATFAALSPLFAGEAALYRELALRGEPYRMADLALSGDDLVELGIEGPACGEVLSALLDAVIKTPGLNSRAALLRILRGEGPA